MDKKIDLLLKEFQGVNLRLDRVEKQLNEEATYYHRTRRNDLNERRDGSTHRHRDDDEDITRWIKVEAPMFDGVHDPQILVTG